MMFSRLKFSFITLLAFLFTFSFASAQGSTPLSDAFNKLLDAIRPLFEFLVGTTTTGASVTSSLNEIFLAKILLIVLVFTLVYVVLSSLNLGIFESNSWALWVVAVAVSLLGIRPLDGETIYAIMLPSSTLGVALSAGIPFVLYFFVVKNFELSVARRFAWIFFAVIFAVLYLLREQMLGEAAWIYVITFFLSFVMIIFDGTIKAAMNRISLEKMKNDASYSVYAQLTEKREQLNKELVLAIQNNHAARVTALKRNIANIDKELSKINI